MFNLKEETRNGYTISAEMKNVWAVEMELLKKLLEVCEKHHLRVWAEGGTLLGAVREHGYIPWDDDIDMAMLREDYDKLQTVASQEFRSPYFFQSGFTDNYPYGYTRLRMDNTAAILPKGIYHNYHQGIFIDIFPLDAMPDDPDKQKKLIEKTLIEREDLKLYCNPWFSFTSISHNIKMVKLLISIKLKGFKEYFKRYDENFRVYKLSDCQYISLFSWFYNERYVRKKEWYSDSIYLPFENIFIPAPKHYHEVLKKQFGDYMKPVKAKTMHGGFEVLDANRSYLYYIPILRKKHRWDGCKTRINVLLTLLKMKK